jgi:LPXTG-motif cell wall-anchored protein
MKTTVQRRLALLAGLFLLTLLVFATGVQVAQAVLVTGAGVGSDAVSFTASAHLAGSTPAAQRAHQQGVAVSGTRVATSARTQGRGGITLAPPAAASGVQPASSGTSSTTAWIVAGSAAALLIVGIAAWVLTRRRRQPGELASATYCAQHPEDSLCTAA